MSWLEATAGALVAVLIAGAAMAQEASPIAVEVLVCQTSAAPGGIDGACQKLHAKLRHEFRYESLKRVQSRSLRLALDEVGSVSLPNGKRVHVRPLQVGEGSALLAVEVQGSVKTDLRVRNGHLVVIGAEGHGDGKLVIGLEPSW